MSDIEPAPGSLGPGRLPPHPIPSPQEERGQERAAPWLALVAALALLLAWGQSALVAVDAAEFALVTRFGAPVARYDGATESGLVVKMPWPIDAVTRLDRRAQLLELPPVEALTRDAAGGAVENTVAVESFALWRIPDSECAERFARSLGTPDQVARVLVPRLSARTASAVSESPLDDLVGVRPADQIEARAAAFRRRVLGGGELERTLLGEYGVELVDWQLRRVRYPEAVRAGIAERIRGERARKAAEYESEGRRRAASVASAAERGARTTEAEARAAQERLEGEASAQADALRNRAFAEDRELAELLLKLKAYRAVLGESKDVLLLSTKHPLFDLLLGPPRKPAPPAGGKP